MDRKIPFVSIIVPCYNEVETIAALLRSIHDQDYPNDSIEVVFADGMSNDGTRAKIRDITGKFPDIPIQLIDNPQRSIPTALNHAISASHGEIIVRLDAHSIPASDYVTRCVQVLEQSGAANVGGVWIITPRNESSIAKGIAVAAAHTLGAGGARYRIGGDAGAVETVPFGAFRRQWLEKVGPFNESLLTNEDYEYNARIRLAGGVVWFDPSIQSIYFARATFQELAKQYWRYGYWKARMLKLFPSTLHWRQALPPLFITFLLIFSLLSPFLQLSRWLLAIQLGTYLLITLMSGIQQVVRKRDLGLILTFPVSLWVMHFSWGLGFIWSFFNSRFRSGRGDEQEPKADF